MMIETSDNDDDDDEYIRNCTIGTSHKQSYVDFYEYCGTDLRSENKLNLYLGNICLFTLDLPIQNMYGYL